jgi:hypothetical protein
MSRVHFAKPSAWRVFWSLFAAAFVVYVVAVVVVFISAAFSSNRPPSTSSNEHVGLLMWDLIFAAPVFMLTLWFVTIPVIVALGVLCAIIRLGGPNGGAGTSAAQGNSLGSTADDP